MLFRVLFALSYIVLVIGVGRFLGQGLENLSIKLVFLAAAFAFLLTRPVDRIVLLLLGLTFVLVFFCAMLTDYPDFSWQILINSLNQFTIVFALLAGTPSPRDRDALLKISAWVPLGFLVLALLYQGAGIHPLFAKEYSSAVYRLSGQLNPAFASGLAMCGTFSALQLSFGRNKKFVLLAGCNLLILLAAGGRMGLVNTIILCGFSILLSRRVNVGGKIGYIGAALFAAIPIAAIFGSKILTRFTSSGDNGRDLMWDYLYSLAKEYPTGIGFGHEYFSVPERISILTGSSAAHNDFIRIMVELGHTGVALFYTLITLAVLRVAFRNKNSGGLLIVVAYGCFLLLSLTDNALATPPYFPIVFLAYVANLRGEEERSPNRGPARQLTPAALVAYRREMMRKARELPDDGASPADNAASISRT